MSEPSNQSGLTDQEQIRQLTATANRIRGEREALRRDNAKFRAANEKWRTDSIKEKRRNDKTIDDLYNRWKEAEEKMKQLQVPPSRLPSHQEMGGHHIRLPPAEGRASHSATTGALQRPSELPVPANQPAQLEDTSFSQAVKLTPQRLTSETSQETVGRQEATESDSQAESESQEQ